MDYLFVAAGLGLLLAGGEFLVRGAVALARRLGVSPLIIGLTIVAYGTSAPELLVSLEAHLSGAPGIAIGNVVGSNIANILLIVGVSALIYPIVWRAGATRVNCPVLLGSAAVLVLVGLTGAISVWAALPMLAALIVFTLFSYRRERGREADSNPCAALTVAEVEELARGPQTMFACVVAVAGGFAAVIAGSHLLVTGAVGIARGLGVSETVIGLTLVAFGTSLPELATCAVAAVRRHSEIALGNVVGSNIFNTLGIMGVVPLFGPLPVPEQMLVFDFWVMLGATVFFVAWTYARDRMGRALAAVFVLGYALYVACQYLGFSALSA